MFKALLLALPILIAQFAGPHAGAQIVGVGNRGVFQTVSGGGSPRTFTHVQSCGGQNSGGVGSATVTCSNPIGAGHLLYVCLANANGADLTLTWSGDSGTFVKDVGYSFDAGSGQTFRFACYYVISSGGGGSTLSAVDSGGNFFWPATTVEEFSYTGGTGSPSVDVSGTGNQGSGSSATSQTLTTTADGDLVLGFASQGASATMSAGSGFTAGATTSASSISEYQVQTSAGSTTATFTVSASWGAHVIAFK